MGSSTSFPSTKICSAVVPTLLIVIGSEECYGFKKGGRGENGISVETASGRAIRNGSNSDFTIRSQNVTDIVQSELT
jgi:hypothetical protein